MNFLTVKTGRAFLLAAGVSAIVEPLSWWAEIPLLAIVFYSIVWGGLND